MNLLLHIESSTDVCAVALSDGDQLIDSVSSKKGRAHISELSILIDRLLGKNGFEYKGLSGISVSRGPGSYTGLRVGYATAKGLCLALNIPLIEVATLQSLAYGLKKNDPNGLYLMPMLDARRMEVYTALYDYQLNLIIPESALILTLNSLKQFTRNCNFVVTGGNGSVKLEGVEGIHSIKDRFKIHNIECHAKHLVSLAWQQYQACTFADLAYSEPFYLKPPNITVSKKPLL